MFGFFAGEKYHGGLVSAASLPSPVVDRPGRCATPRFRPQGDITYIIFAKRKANSIVQRGASALISKNGKETMYEKPEARHIQRRMLAASMAGVCGLASTALGRKIASNQHAEMHSTALIHALRSIGKPVCTAAAGALAMLPPRQAGFDLHLCRAGLDEADARILAEGMLQPNDGGGRFLTQHSPDGLPPARLAWLRAFFQAIAVLARSELRLVGREEAAGRLLQAPAASSRARSGTRVPPPGSRLTVRKGLSIMRKRPQPVARADR
jgi:hypothetical protein